MSDEKKAREFWIYDNGEEPCLAYASRDVARNEIKSETIHVREVLPDEPDWKSIAEDAVTRGKQVCDDAVIVGEEAKKWKSLAQELAEALAEIDTQQSSLFKNGSSVAREALAKFNAVKGEER